MVLLLVAVAVVLPLLLLLVIVVVVTVVIVAVIMVVTITEDVLLRTARRMSYRVRKPRSTGSSQLTVNTRLVPLNVLPLSWCRNSTYAETHVTASQFSVSGVVCATASRKLSKVKHEQKQNLVTDKINTIKQLLRNQHQASQHILMEMLTNNSSFLSERSKSTHGSSGSNISTHCNSSWCCRHYLAFIYPAHTFTFRNWLQRNA